jgi:soluble lytic murein transglycosylase-like protein
MAERNNAPPRMTALGLLEQMRRSNAANREAPFDPIAAFARERRAGPTAPLFGGQRQQPLPIPPTPPAVIPPPPPQQAAPQAAAAPQARTPAQALPVPPRPPQLGADGNPIPPAVLPQVPGAEPQPLHVRFNPENPYVATATQMAERYGLPPNVLLSLLHRESRFDPNAVSRVGALGLGQLMPGTARDLGVDPRDPMQNIEGSARYLRQQLDRFGGDMTLALAAYNAGPRRVAEAGNAIPDIAETRAYVPTVMRNAGMPGYAKGGLAELDHKYSRGNLVEVPGVATPIPAFDYHVRANRIRTPRAPRPAPREELTADQLNAMVLDRLAARYDVAPESIMAAEARERIGRAMGYAEGGLADLHQKYESGGRVKRTVGALRRAVRGSAPEPVVENPRAVMGGNNPPRSVLKPTMTPDEAMAIATRPQPGAGVPRLEGDDLERANELSQRVLDFRAAQMRLPVDARVQPRPEDQLFPPARFDQPLEAGPSNVAQELESLRIQNISPTQSLPGSRAAAGLASDLAERYGTTMDRIVGDLDPIARIMRGEEVPGATPAQIASARAGEFYNMRPVYDVLRGQGVSHDEALRRIRQESQAIAGTSPRTDTEQNVLNSAFLQNRMARGLPIDKNTVENVTGPGSGYGMIYDQHPALTQGLLEGTVSLAQNPKPTVFGRNISGDRTAVTADVHNVRAVNMIYNDVNPGGLPASSFDTAAKYREYVDAYTPNAEGVVRGMSDDELREILVARPSGQKVRGQSISTEYPIYNDITTNIAERLGLTPADAQALMWFHYGPRTGLASEAHTVPELLNQRMSITSQALDIPPEEVLRLYTRNMIPLAGVAPAAILAREGEAAPSLEELDQRYAEGGRVMSDEEYDRRLLERMKRDTGRTTESTNAEQARAIRSAGYDAAQLASDIFLPQSPLDAALMVALGPGGRMARLAGSTALMAMEPSEAEAGGLRRAVGRALGRQTPDEPPMVAMHNVRQAGLEKIANNEGVVVAPSIGISRADDPMDSFGEISLIASPQTVDPRRTPVYARDAYTPRYPSVIPKTVRDREKEYVRLYNDDTGESRLLPHTPRNALRVMTNDPWRGGEDFITDNWLLGQITPQFRNMSELRGARDRLVPRTDKSVEDWQNQLGALRQEFREALPDSIRDNFNFIDSHTRNMAEAVQRGPGGMEYINRNYYGNAIPEDLLERTRAHLEAGRDLPATYFEAKPRRIVPLNEFQGAVVPVQASKDVTDLLRRYGVDDIRYYNRLASRDDADRTAQIRQFERLMFGAAPVAAGAAVADLDQKYAEGGAVSAQPAIYDPDAVNTLANQIEAGYV